MRHQTSFYVEAPIIRAITLLSKANDVLFSFFYGIDLFAAYSLVN